MRTTIGERVRAYRLRRGLTQAHLAHLVGRSERWLIDVERGGVDPRLSDALALARELCVAVDDLAGATTPVEERTGRPPPRPPVHSSGGTTGAVAGARGVPAEMLAALRTARVSVEGLGPGRGGPSRIDRGDPRCPQRLGLRAGRIAGPPRPALVVVTQLRGRPAPQVHSSFLTSSGENGRR